MSHVLCRRCAHTTQLSMLSCPRCGFALPYWRSRKWRLALDPPRPAFGRHCPRCGDGTVRRRSSLLVRGLRLLTLGHCSSRQCYGCGWSGPAFHGRLHRSTRRRRRMAAEGE